MPFLYEYFSSFRCTIKQMSLHARAVHVVYMWYTCPMSLIKANGVRFLTGLWVMEYFGVFTSWQSLCHHVLINHWVLLFSTKKSSLFVHILVSWLIHSFDTFVLAIKRKRSEHYFSEAETVFFWTYKCFQCRILVNWTEEELVRMHYLFF